MGDSRIVLGQIENFAVGSASATRLTVDHRMDDPLEAVRIDQAGGFVFKGRVCGVLAVTRSLGDQILKPYVTAHPAVREITLPAVAAAATANDSSRFLIVACDGLWDVMTDDEAVALVHDFCYNNSTRSADNDDYDDSKKATVADFLVAQLLQRGTSDNVTAVVVWL